MSNPIDEEIIKRFISGEGKEEAFTLLYEKYINFVYDFGRTMGIPRSEIDDFVQEVFIKLSQKLDKFNLKKKFFPWFYSIVKNHCYDYLKKVKNNKDSDLIIKTYTSNPYEFDIETINQVRDIISKLPPNQREIIFLKYYQELTPEEIAETLGYSIRNVYFLLNKAIEKFEEEWNRK